MFFICTIKKNGGRNMTLGKKIKEARKQLGLSQEQLAEKINVSRSAIAKWEIDKGIPDIENLKVLSQLLNVSIDDLVDDEKQVNEYVIKEAVDLSQYDGRKKVKKDKVVLAFYPEAKVYNLIGKEKLTKREKIVDDAIGFLTTAPFGIVDFVNGIKNLDKEFYLVEQSGKQFLVIVYDEYIESRQLNEKILKKKFIIENWEFIKSGLVK